MSTELKQELAELLEEKAKRKRVNAIGDYFPSTGPYRRELYSKHMDFFKAGALFKERGFVAGNRVGKTIAGAFEMTCHLTGVYPDWWEGRKFNHPIKAWAVGKTNETTRDVLQFELLGMPGEFGTGMIPKDSLVGKPTSRQGVTNGVQDIYVKHASGGKSVVTFKSYVQEVASFMGTKLDVVWHDEECLNLLIYTECLTRTMQTSDPQGGIMYTTFTPLAGLSPVILSFLPGGKFPEDGVVRDELDDGTPPSKYVVNCDWDDVPHLDEDAKKLMLKAYSPMEREARSRGIPSIGSGAIYPVIWDDVIVEPFKIPIWFECAYGMDFGWNCTACVWGARDPDSGVIYIYSEHYLGKTIPPVHAEAIKQRGEWLRGSCDPAGGGSSQGDGTMLIDQYTSLGLDIEPGNNAQVAGFAKVLGGLQSDQIKIFATCKHLMAELRTYRYGEDGKPVKGQADHAADALRYLIMSFDDVAFAQPDPDADSRIYATPTKGKNPVTGY